MKNLMVSLFDHSGVMAEPWHRAGYSVLTVDIQHPQGCHEIRPGFFTLRADLMRPEAAEWLRGLVRDYRVVFVAAFPPCTHLAVSGARWFKGKGLRALSDSVAMFATAADFCEKSGAPYMIENPVSTISTYWRKADFAFHPWQFAGLCPDDCYTKKTCLWTGGGFVMPEAVPLEGVKPDNRIHAAPPGPDRAAFRSKTPQGFAQAVFVENEWALVGGAA